MGARKEAEVAWVDIAKHTDRRVIVKHVPSPKRNFGARGGVIESEARIGTEALAGFDQVLHLRVL